MAEYKKETDKVHKVTLKSKITHALWGCKSASVGEKVNLEVRTQFVGNGSEIQIKVQDKSGKTIEKITDKIYADLFKGSVTIPDKAKEELTFTAKLPKHGLEKKSESLNVFPPRIITNAKWSQTEARRGDIVKLTADTKGIPDDTEVIISIYEHDQDEAHDFITKLPVRVKANKIETEWEFEYHEDVDDIPTDEEMKKAGKSYNHPEYFFVARCYGAEAKSGLLRFKDWIEIELYYDDGIPIANEKYIIYYADGAMSKGKLNEHGFALIEDIPPGRVIVEYPDVDKEEETDDTVEEITVDEKESESAFEKI